MNEAQVKREILEQEVAKSIDGLNRLMKSDDPSRPEWTALA